MIPILDKLKGKFSQEKVSVGLDIGTQAIKFVKLRFIKDAVELCDFALEPIKPDLAQSIKRIAQAHALRKVNISLSGPATIIRYVNFPRMSKDELKQALKFEAQKYIPFAIDEINLDSCVLKSDLPDNKMLVLLAAVKKDFLSQRIKLLEDSAVMVNIVDIDSLSLINVFNFNYSQDEKLNHKTIALLNIGASQSNLNIVEDGSPSLSRDINIAGNNFTQKLADTFGLDFKSAQELKLNPDNEKADKLTAAIESVMSSLATEIRVSFDYYESQSATAVAKIFLTGGGSLPRGLKDSLANMLGIEVEQWDPLSKISISGSVDSARAKSLFAQLTVAIGLALRP